MDGTSSRPAADVALRDIQLVSSAETLRVLANEERLAMTALLVSEARTATEVGRELGIPTNRASYHLRQLREAGLIEEIGTGRRRWKEERYYRASARHYVVDPALTCDDETGAALRRKIHSTFFDWRRREVLGIDDATFARQVVEERIPVSPGQVVLIMFGPDGFELAEMLAVEVQARGAIPRPRFWSRNTAFAIADRFDAAAMEVFEFLPPAEMETLGAVVFLSAAVAQGGPPNEAQQAKLPFLLGSVSRWHRELRERRIPYLEIALAHRGEFEGGPMSVEDAIDVYWRCVTFDPGTLSRRAGALATQLGRGGRLHLSCPLGTDLTLGFDARHVYPSDGVIDAVDIAAGRSFDEIPTGTVSIIPDPETVSGTFVAGWALVVEERFEEPRVVVERGRIVGIEGRSDVSALRDRLKRAAGDPDLVSELRFGLNEAGRGPTGKPPLDACLAGAVTLGFGNNELLGGNVRSTMGLLLPSFQVTARLDDLVLVSANDVSERR